MAKKMILVGVGPNGEVEVEAIGYKDSSCLKDVEDVAKQLGAITSITKKPEANRPHKKRKAKKRLVAQGLPSRHCG